MSLYLPTQLDAETLFREHLDVLGGTGEPVPNIVIVDVVKGVGWVDPGGDSERLIRVEGLFSIVLKDSAPDHVKEWFAIPGRGNRRFSDEA